MPVYPANGIVLHRFSLGETDRVVTLLTREAGKLNAVAKGSRRPGSRLSGATELFTYARLLLAVGKNLDIVSQCEISESFPTVRADLGLLARATYLCELVDRLIEEREPDPELFDLLLSALYLLQRKVDLPDVVVHAFELRSLAHRGYGPVLDGCVKCGGSEGLSRSAFSPSLGGLLCETDRFSSADAIQITSSTLDLLRELACCEPEAMLILSPDAHALAEANRCLRWHIRYRTDRDLKSAEFVDMLRLWTSRE